jgi:hypothetical protein
LLRLMVSDPLAMNMSNTLRNAPGTAQQQAAGKVQKAPANGSSRAGKYLLFDFPPVRKVLLGLYDSIFRWYYIFISADHGLAIIYFLQSDVLPTLLASGVQIVLLTDDSLKEKITQRFGQPGLVVEGLRFKQARQYLNSTSIRTQHWLHFLRWMGGSNRINTTAMDGHMRQMGGSLAARQANYAADPAGDCCHAPL